jgi:four helix bundle protein
MKNPAGDFEFQNGKTHSAHVTIVTASWFVALQHTPVTQQLPDLKQRTKQFALRIIRLYRNLPATDEAKILGKQLLRSGTSVGANYRAACRARSKAEFIAKLGIVLEEADETVFWLELLVESGVGSRERLQPLVKEADELTSVFVASLCTAKGIAP